MSELYPYFRVTSLTCTWSQAMGFYNDLVNDGIPAVVAYHVQNPFTTKQGYTTQSILYSVWRVGDELPMPHPDGATAKPNTEKFRASGIVMISNPYFLHVLASDLGQKRRILKKTIKEDLLGKY